MKRILPLLFLPALALAVDAPFTYTGDYTVAPHATNANWIVATFTSSGSLTMTADKALVRLLVVGGVGVAVFHTPFQVAHFRRQPFQPPEGSPQHVLHGELLRVDGNL